MAPALLKGDSSTRHTADSDKSTTKPNLPMKSAALTINTPFQFAPAAQPVRRTPVQRSEAPTSGLFSRLENETNAGSRPENLVFLLLALTGAAWPTWEACRIIAGL